jgi:hypothetical protein
MCTAAMLKGHRDIQHNDTSHNDNQGTGFIATLSRFFAVVLSGVTLANLITLSVAMISVAAPFLGLDIIVPSLLKFYNITIHN